MGTYSGTEIISYRVGYASSLSHFTAQAQKSSWRPCTVPASMVSSSPCQSSDSSCDKRTFDLGATTRETPWALILLANANVPPFLAYIARNGVDLSSFLRSHWSTFFSSSRKKKKQSQCMGVWSLQLHLLLVEPHLYSQVPPCYSELCTVAH
jgi:hypothetical protein